MSPTLKCGMSKCCIHQLECLTNWEQERTEVLHSIHIIFQVINHPKNVFLFENTNLQFQTLETNFGSDTLKSSCVFAQEAALLTMFIDILQNFIR